MATYKVVDADQLDADMTSVANAIRTKGGTSGKLAWPGGYQLAVEAIETGGGMDDLILRNVTEVESNVGYVGDYSFAYCYVLKTVDFPIATRLGSYAFRNCSSLTNTNFPVVTGVGNYSFAYCYVLKTVDFPAATQIGDYAFRSSTGLTTLILRNTEAVCNLTGTNAFRDTPIGSGTGYIYVPAALLDAYKTATNWSTHAAQFRALEDYTVDGTTTGKLDETKTGT